MAVVLGLAVVAQGLLRRRSERVACGLLLMLCGYLAWLDSGWFTPALLASVFVPDRKAVRLLEPPRAPRVQPQTDLEEIFS